MRENVLGVERIVFWFSLDKPPRVFGTGSDTVQVWSDRPHGFSGLHGENKGLELSRQTGFSKHCGLLPNHLLSPLTVDNWELFLWLPL
jgi:hypothetical protein